MLNPISIPIYLTQITINVINSKSTKIHQTNESCSGQGVTINFKKTEGAQSEADEVSDAPESVGDEKIKEPSESSSDSEDEEDKDQDLDKKKREADSSNPEPVVD